MPDNGDVFNILFLNMAEQSNITLKTTAAESPWSNDKVERHNNILAKTIEKLILDSNNILLMLLYHQLVNEKNDIHIKVIGQTN